jgi:hypothetical protein
VPTAIYVFTMGVALITPEKLADYVAEKAKKDPAVRALIKDVQMYDGLQEHIGWRHLRNKIKEQEDGLWAPILRRLKRGEVIDQREIDHHRGFIEGAVFAVTHPEVADTNLEKAARLAYMLGTREIEEEGSEDA